MLANVKSIKVNVVPMTKFEYYDKILHRNTQHLENKWVDGFFCNWNDYKFWLQKDIFDKLYILRDD